MDIEREVVYEHIEGKDYPYLELLHCLYGLIGFLCFMLSPIPLKKEVLLLMYRKKIND